LKGNALGAEYQNGSEKECLGTSLHIEDQLEIEQETKWGWREDLGKVNNHQVIGKNHWVKGGIHLEFIPLFGCCKGGGGKSNNKIALEDSPVQGWA